MLSQMRQSHQQWRPPGLVVLSDGKLFPRRLDVLGGVEIVAQARDLPAATKGPEVDFLVAIAKAARWRGLDHKFGGHLPLIAHDRQHFELMDLELRYKLKEFKHAGLAMARGHPSHPGLLG